MNIQGSFDCSPSSASLFHWQDQETCRCPSLKYSDQHKHCDLQDGREGVEAVYETTDEFHEAWVKKSREVIMNAAWRKQKLGKRVSLCPQKAVLNSVPVLDLLEISCLPAKEVMQVLAACYSFSLSCCVRKAKHLQFIAALWQGYIKHLLCLFLHSMD